MYSRLEAFGGTVKSILKGAVKRRESPVGTVVSGAISGAVLGAAIGTFVAPVVGTLAGAGIGLIVGGIARGLARGARLFGWNNMRTATYVAAYIHTPPSAFGKVMSEVQPRMAIAYHALLLPELLQESTEEEDMHRRHAC